MPAGRPPFWTPERKAEAKQRILHELATTTRSLAQVLQAEGMPYYTTVLEWRREDAEFEKDYTRTREDQADMLADEVVDIADTEDDPHKARVRMDARKWKAGKMKPKSYGDRVDINADVNITLDDAAVEARLAVLLGKAGVVAIARGEGETEGTP